MRTYRFKEVDSTNKYLREKSDLCDYDLVISETQSAGKGRRGNDWKSDIGAALFSFALKKDANLDLKEYRKLPLVVGLSVLKGLSCVEDLSFQFKWTNDVYADGKKISGVLVEFSNDFFIIGVGVNVNNKEFGELSQKATSLSLETGREYNVEKVIHEIVSEFKIQYAKFLKGEWPLIKAEINSLNYLKGKNVLIQLPNKSVEGVAGDIVEDGMLEVYSGGEMLKFDIGEVHIKL